MPSNEAAETSGHVLLSFVALGRLFSTLFFFFFATSFFSRLWNPLPGKALLLDRLFSLAFEH